MKHIIETIRSSWYDPHFYEEIGQQTIGKAIGLFFFLGTVGMLVTFVGAAPNIVRFAYSDVPARVAAVYPDDLEITVENGRVSVNKELPYYVPNTLFATDTIQYIAVFDLNNTLPVSIKEVSTIALFKDAYVILPGQNDTQQITPYTELGTTTGTLHKGMISSLVEKINPYFTYGVLGIALFAGVGMVFFGGLLWTTFHMVYVMVPASLVWLLQILQKSRPPFFSAYMQALYATIPVAILSFAASFLLQVQLPWFGYTAIVLLIVVANTWQRTAAKEQDVANE